jgi:hypothetical protein
MDGLNVYHGFYLVISVGLVFFWTLELRLNRRYKASLLIWEELGGSLEQKDISLESLNPAGRDILEQWFLLGDDRRLLHQNDRYLLTAPLAACLPSLPSSPYRFVPALLTTAGVLGTFLGISLGLIEFKTQGADSAALMKSANTLLDGMKTAFYTSLAGLSASVLFMLVLASTSSSRERRYSRTSAAIRKHCISVNPVSLLHKLSPVGQDELIEKQMRAADSMISSNHQLTEATQLLATIFQEFNGPKLATAISDAVRQTIEKEVAPPLAALPKAVQELREVKEKSSQELIELITASIKEDVVRPMIAQNERVAQVVSTTARSVDELVSQLKNVMAELSSTTTTLNEFQKDTLVKLQDFAESLRTILSQFKDDTEGALNRVSREINQALAASIDGMGSQREAFEQSAQRAASAFEQQNHSLQSIGAESSQLMEAAKQNLLEGLGTIDEKVRTMSSVTQQELEHFRIEYQKNLTGFFQQQENLLEQTLGKQREGLAGVVADFRKVFEEEHLTRKEQYAAIYAQYEQLQMGVALVQELVEAVGLNKSAAFDQLNDTARAVSAQVGSLRQSYAEASERFNKVTEQMPEAMTDYFERAREGNEKFFEQFDDSAAKVHGKLAEAANLLVVAMQTIEARQLEAATELD